MVMEFNGIGIYKYVPRLRLILSADSKPMRSTWLRVWAGISDIPNFICCVNFIRLPIYVRNAASLDCWIASYCKGWHLKHTS